MNNAGFNIPMVQMDANAVGPTVLTGALKEFHGQVGRGDSEKLTLNILDWNRGGPVQEKHCPPYSFETLVKDPEPEIRIMWVKHPSNDCNY